MKLHSFFESLRELRTFLLLFTTQALSSLGSAMTSYALVIWAYQQSGSALSTALLTVSSYAPYVVFSLFCGALVDRLDTRWTMRLPRAQPSRRSSCCKRDGCKSRTCISLTR